MSHRERTIPLMCKILPWFCVLLWLGCGKTPVATPPQEVDKSQTPDIYIRQLVLAGDFDTLERIAEATLQEKGAEGEPLVFAGDFYRWISSLPVNPHTEELWEPFHNQLLAWQEAKPGSIHAKLAIATYWSYYAWKARGPDYAHTVSEEQWKLFHERLATSEKLIEALPGPPMANPQYHDLKLELGTSLGYSKSRFEEIFRKAIELRPYYAPYYFHAARYYLPRWHGAPGEVGAYIKQTVRSLDPEVAEFASFKLVWGVCRFERENTFKECGIDYADVKQALLKYTADPANILDANYLCLYACYAGDAETAKTMFDRIGANWDRTCWGKEDRFLEWKQKYG